MPCVWVLRFCNRMYGGEARYKLMKNEKVSLEKSSAEKDENQTNVSGVKINNVRKSGT